MIYRSLVVRFSSGRLAAAPRPLCGLRPARTPDQPPETMRTRQRAAIVVPLMWIADAATSAEPYSDDPGLAPGIGLVVASAQFELGLCAGPGFNPT